MTTPTKTYFYKVSENCIGALFCGLSFGYNTSVMHNKCNIPRICLLLFKRVIKETNILAEIKRMNPGTKTRHGKQTNATKNNIT